MTTGTADVPESLPPALRRAVSFFATDTGRRVLWWVLGALLALTFLAFLAVGANRPADPTLAVGAVPGVDEAALRVATPGGGEQVSCVLVADTDDERARGLMEVTDLGEHAGMAFLFEDDTTSGFWMRNTPMPLTIAFYDAEGRFVAADDMEPCADSPDCPSYPPPSRPYRVAIEVPKGQAEALGLVPGSVARVGGACA